MARVQIPARACVFDRNVVLITSLGTGIQVFPRNHPDMPDTSLEELLERNERHVAGLPANHFVDVETAQHPAAVSICCSDSRIPQSGMWDVEEPGWLFTPSTIGNQVWDVYEGEHVVDGSVLYPIHATDTNVIIVVGHTGCGAVTSTLEHLQEDTEPLPPGIQKWIDSLLPVIADGLDDERIDATADVSLVDQLVEYNVDRQVEFLLEREEIPPDEEIYGFVYDFQGVYGTDRGRAYLVNANGKTRLDRLRDAIPARFEYQARRLC